MFLVRWVSTIKDTRHKKQIFDIRPRQDWIAEESWGRIAEQDLSQRNLLYMENIRKMKKHPRQKKSRHWRWGKTSAFLTPTTVSVGQVGEMNFFQSLDWSSWWLRTNTKTWRNIYTYVRWHDNLRCIRDIRTNFRAFKTTNTGTDPKKNWPRNVYAKNDQCFPPSLWSTSSNFFWRSGDGAARVWIWKREDVYERHRRWRKAAKGERIWLRFCHNTLGRQTTINHDKYVLWRTSDILPVSWKASERMNWGKKLLPGRIFPLLIFALLFFAVPLLFFFNV